MRLMQMESDSFVLGIIVARQKIAQARDRSRAPRIEIARDPDRHALADHARAHHSYQLIELVGRVSAS